MALAEGEAQAPRLGADILHAGVDDTCDFVEQKSVTAAALALEPQHRADGADAVRTDARHFLGEDLAQHAHCLEAVGLRHAEAAGYLVQLAL